MPPLGEIKTFPFQGGQTDASTCISPAHFLWEGLRPIHHPQVEKHLGATMREQSRPLPLPGSPSRRKNALKPGRVELTVPPQLSALLLVCEAHAVVAVGLAPLTRCAIYLVEVSGTVGGRARAELWEVTLAHLLAAKSAGSQQLVRAKGRYREHPVLCGLPVLALIGSPGKLTGEGPQPGLLLGVVKEEAKGYTGSQCCPLGCWEGPWLPQGWRCLGWHSPCIGSSRHPGHTEPLTSWCSYWHYSRGCHTPGETSWGCVSLWLGKQGSSPSGGSTPPHILLGS